MRNIDKNIKKEQRQREGKIKNDQQRATEGVARGGGCNWKCQLRVRGIQRQVGRERERRGKTSTALFRAERQTATCSSSLWFLKAHSNSRVRNEANI